MSKISQAIVKIVLGTKGETTHKWHRKSRTTLDKITMSLGSMDNFYYAKVYHFKQGKKIGTKKNANNKTVDVRELGTVLNQFAYIYWDKDGVLTVKPV